MDTLEEVRRLLAVPAVSMVEERNRAAVALLFLSGMRLGALMTLPIECVNLETLQIAQLPSKGVATKFHKAAVTSLLNIADLLEVVREWDGRIRAALPPEGYWFALIGQQRGGSGRLRTDKGGKDPLQKRPAFGKQIKKMCEAAGVPYKHPHCLRHGHAVYGVKHARTVEELKAVSQNLMHSSVSITDGLYGNLTSDDVNNVITRLGGAAQFSEAGNVDALALALVQVIRANPDLLRQFLEAQGEPAIFILTGY